MLIAGVVIYAFVRAKTRVHHASQVDAMRDMLAGGGRVPSWAGNNDHREEFVYTIQQLAARKSVPPPYIRNMLEEKDYFRTLVHYAGALEQNNQSFAEQQIGVSDLIVKSWMKLSSSDQAKYINGASSHTGT